MTSEPSGRGVRGMLNDLLHPGEDSTDRPADESPDGSRDGSPNGTEHGEADGTAREPGRYGAAHDPDAERPATGTVGSGAIATSGIGAGPRPGPRPGPPAPPQGAHRLVEPREGDGSLFHGRDAVPSQAPTFGPRAEQRNWAGTGGPGPSTPGGLAPSRPADAAPAPDGDPGSSAARPGAPEGNGRSPDAAADTPATATPLPPATSVVIDGGEEAERPGPTGAAPDAAPGTGTPAGTPATPPAPDRPVARRGVPTTGEAPPPERLVPLDRARELGARWDAVKGSFVDEPRDAVRQADGLVGELLDELDRLFREQRTQLEQGLDDQETTTEDLRLALRRYRSFFDRLIDL